MKTARGLMPVTAAIGMLTLVAIAALAFSGCEEDVTTRVYGTIQGEWGWCCEEGEGSNPIHMILYVGAGCRLSDADGAQYENDYIAGDDYETLFDEGGCDFDFWASDLSTFYCAHGGGHIETGESINLDVTLTCCCDWD